MRQKPSLPRWAKASRAASAAGVALLWKGRGVSRQTMRTSSP
jgi:hypothetical protein